MKLLEKKEVVDQKEYEKRLTASRFPSWWLWVKDKTEMSYEQARAIFLMDLNNES